MGTPKIPFRRHPLKSVPRSAYTPPADEAEATDTTRRGYWPGANYTPAEVAWMKAVERFQHTTGRKFLSHVDYLRLAVEFVPAAGITTTPTTAMNPELLLDKLTAAGFKFVIGADGEVGFRPPDDISTNPAAQEMYTLLAWQWEHIHPLAAQLVTDHPCPHVG